MITTALFISIVTKSAILVCGPARFPVLSNAAAHLGLILQARIRRSQHQTVDAGVTEHAVCDNFTLVDALVLVRIKAQIQN
mmetsp:Transcript_15919/g.20102  ORF Transcript_15919/g.20102 Transcript_15919/m.20102 type:complete len:81 (+) Transcript_15919:2669-2911(+)